MEIKRLTFKSSIRYTGDNKSLKSRAATVNMHLYVTFISKRVSFPFETAMFMSIWIDTSIDIIMTSSGEDVWSICLS